MELLVVFIYHLPCFRIEWWVFNSNYYIIENIGIIKIFWVSSVVGFLPSLPSHLPQLEPQPLQIKADSILNISSPHASGDDIPPKEFPNSCCQNSWTKCQPIYVGTIRTKSNKLIRFGFLTRRTKNNGTKGSMGKGYLLIINSLNKLTETV